MSETLYVQFEAASGYALFEVVQFEEIGTMIESNQQAITDLSTFSRCVKLKSFQPFSTAAEALENINAISEHACSPMLKTFLELNLPKGFKKGKGITVGVVESSLATAVSEGVGCKVRSDEIVREVVRGIRCHFDKFITELASGVAENAQRGLGHSYSRAKVKFNPARSDNMIIQSIALLDQMDKDLNTFAMRVREWYSWHFPELKQHVKDNYMFARCAALIQDKKTLFEEGCEDKIAKLTEITGDDDIAKAVVQAAKTSMGMDCSPVDMVNIINFTQRMVKLAEYRKQLQAYLQDKMNIVAPNLSTLIGDTVAARLISKAGSLTSLAKAPASTVQILGAEKALFRALKTKGNTPKYGLIYHSTFIGRAEAKNKGRISRYLANKCSIASRIDSFSDEPNNLFGEKLREQVEERLKFYETGTAPRKNADVMNEVMKELGGGQDDDMDIDDATPKKKKSKGDKKDKSEKKKKKRKAEESEPEPEAPKEEEAKSAKKAKKEKKEKKKKKKSE